MEALANTTQLINTVKKRNGKKAKFDSNKITQAILNAGAASEEFNEIVAKQLAIKTISLLQQLFQNNKVPQVEEIQDIVEEVLLSSPYKKTAKAYIIYREQHANLRHLLSQNKLDLVDQYLSKKDWQVKENSNMSYSLQGLNNYISNEISKIYWLDKIYTPEIREAHNSGDFHIHDLGQISVYCVGWDLQDLLTIGFTGVHGKIASLPAKHLRTALGQVVNFFFTLQGESAGAQAFANFDTLLAPFIRYDHLGYKEVKQALQEFIFNVNVPTRVGFQTPFSNITLDLAPPKYFIDTPVIIGGKQQKETYGDFQNEMDLFNEAFLDVLAAGDANGRVFSFPIPTYNISKTFEWDNHKLDKIWEVTAKYGIPYFANFINSDMSPDDARSMCCRLRIDNRELQRRGGGLFGANPLTGSVGIVTLNLPRLGLLSKNKEDFIARLDQLLETAKQSLEIKRKALEQFTENGLYPYAKFYLRDIKKRTKLYWHNHFSTIGICGMNEACEHLFKKNLGDQECITFANDIMDHIREVLISFQEETKHLYNLEATPAEGTSYRLARLDAAKYGDKNSDLDHVKVYTNSTQLPVDYTNDIFEVLDLQDSLQAKYTGGTVLHIFLGEAVTDPMAVKNFVRKICENYRLPYLSITPTFSVCAEHGYLTGNQPTCPTCNNTTEVYSRVVGFLRPIDQWNEGKRAEFDRRQLFKTETEIKCK